MIKLQNLSLFYYLEKLEDFRRFEMRINTTLLESL